MTQRPPLTRNERVAYDALLTAPTWLRGHGVSAHQVLIYGDGYADHMTLESMSRALQSLVRKGWAVRLDVGLFTAAIYVSSSTGAAR